jgi:two-component sensor histidine kinase
MAHELRHRLPYGPHAPAAAREVVDALAGTLGSRVLRELRLLASELVTNAVRHGRPDGAGGLRLGIAVTHTTARITVADGGAGFVPPPAPPDLTTPGGWGLVVVDRLADRWGVEAGRGTRVWAEIELAPGGTSAAPGMMAVAGRNV